MLLLDQNAPNTVCMLAVFESEDKARARERDPRREEALQSVRAITAEIYECPPEFIDLTVAAEDTG
jgi:hypothetical protein